MSRFATLDSMKKDAEGEKKDNYYAGGAGDFVLVNAGNSLLNGGFGAGEISVDGFGEEGVGWNLTQDFVANTVTLTVIPEPATLGLVAAFGGGILFIRRLML